ncbi:MAG: hypothetical protein KAH21_02270, partial [Spirochaetaceae bacterium]|nr:hypothetical protein [Spirochaetaceae bacterium]
VLDTEGYRARREESLVRMAHRMADEAVRSHSSRLLEPMNPFERRLIHTAINDRDDVLTKSEGDGLYKRVRVMAKANPMYLKKTARFTRGGFLIGNNYTVSTGTFGFKQGFISNTYSGFQ